PSAWVTPRRSWPDGSVELISFHTPDQNSDNIVAFWRLAHPAEPGKPLHLAYRIHWQGKKPVRSPAGRVFDTLIGGGAKEGSIKFVLDFVGGKLGGIPADAKVESE